MHGDAKVGLCVFIGEASSDFVGYTDLFFCQNEMAGCIFPKIRPMSAFFFRGMNHTPTLPPNLFSLFRRAGWTIHQPERDYLFHKSGDDWVGITYAECLHQIEALSAQLVELGLQPGDRVGFLTENCPWYFLLDLALVRLGMVNASLYPSLSESEIEFVANDAGIKAVLVGSPFLLKKMSKVADRMPGLLQVICLFDDPQRIWQNERVVSYEHWVMTGCDLVEKHRKQIALWEAAVTHENLATLIYTSGTTGAPKGAMLTHGNFIWDIWAGLTLIPVIGPDEKFLSFLPLSHVYERMVSYYLGLYVGAQVAFAQSIDKIATNIGETQPTLIATVPRLLERIEERVRKSTEAGSPVKKKIFRWAISQGRKRRRLKMANRKPGPLLSLGLAVAEKLVFSKIKGRLGGRMKLVISGGAALPVHVAEFFGDIGIVVMEGYGLTETSPFISVNEYQRQVIGTVGRVAPSEEVAIQNPDTGEILALQTFDTFNPTYESPEGEILMRGPNLMKGYWNQPEETAKVIDAEGWFHTGDVGKFYLGNLKITDRLKNIIVNAYGKNIYPTQVENAYLRSDAISQIFIIGDKRDYLTAIVVPNPEELGPLFQKDTAWFEAKEPWIEEEEIRFWLRKEMRRLESDLAKYERVKNFVVKRQPFSLEAGEMTPKQSIKRKVVETKYAEVINGLYAGEVEED